MNTLNLVAFNVIIPMVEGLNPSGVIEKIDRFHDYLMYVQARTVSQVFQKFFIILRFNELYFLILNPLQSFSALHLQARAWSTPHSILHWANTREALEQHRGKAKTVRINIFFKIAPLVEMKVGRQEV